jgi:hypothetical protein
MGATLRDRTIDLDGAVEQLGRRGTFVGRHILTPLRGACCCTRRKRTTPPCTTWRPSARRRRCCRTSRRRKVAELMALGQGSLVGSVVSHDPAFVREFVLGAAGYHGRLHVLDRDSAKESTARLAPAAPGARQPREGRWR